MKPPPICSLCLAAGRDRAAAEMCALRVRCSSVSR
jgi:hypothetical protein